jgi:diguanylate cyclase (GGDEF)-like protein
MNDSILIVDDSPIFHTLIRTYLEGEPVNIHSAYNGSAGVAAAAALSPGLILLDMDMPDVDGFEVCRRLKADLATQSLPIVFLTAGISHNDRITGLDLGANDYMSKRVKPEELRARIRAALRVKPMADDMAMVNGLTKLWNRKYLDLHLPAQISLARRGLRPLSCVLGDIDALANINRLHGEILGDEVLRSAAHIMASEGRLVDLVCYLGDGKFGLVLPGTDQAAGGRLADRVRTEIQRQLQTCNGVAVNVTCSFGLADTRTGSDSSLLDRADAALYLAKRSGHNCVRASHSAAIARIAAG